ncbi:MAG: hypothetical protein H6737_22420 [Alphaproteobacteria bacterium]|nr:hypothetical protein [Alphaproteobacteria bacterium]
MIAWALLGCGPSLPGWLPELGVGPIEAADADEVRIGAPAADVAAWLESHGWQGWRVVDEDLIDSHHRRLDKAGVWVDVRSTETGSRVLLLEDGPPRREIAPVALPGMLEGEPAPLLAATAGCQASDADVRFTPGRYLWSGGRVQHAGTWTIDGGALVLDGPKAMRCEGLVLVGGPYPTLVSCGPEPLVRCGAPPGPTLAVLDAGGGADRVALVGGAASVDAGSFVFTGPSAGTEGLVVEYAPGRPGAVERAEGLAYRLHRDLGEPVALGRAESPVAEVVVRVGKPVTEGPE